MEAGDLGEVPNGFPPEQRGSDVSSYEVDLQSAA
jgi:hypothetical protein